MESATDPSHGRSIAWLPEMDRILLVGMKHGRQGVHEATNRILSLRAGLTRADCWKRLRLLRQNGDGNHPAPRNWPTEIKELLREGYREGGKKKRDALKAIRHLYPGLPSNTPSRFALRQGWISRSAQHRFRRPWTEYEQRKLWELAGYETAAKIGERLGRSEGAVRFRLKSLGLSVKVKDGWSFRALQEMLHVGPSKLRRFIADGALRVRDPRITASSLAVLAQRQLASANEAENGQVDAMREKLLATRKAYSWGTTAKLLSADMKQIRNWIASGELKIVDGFITERAFQDFCKQGGSELNSALLGEDVRDWLVEGYSLPPGAPKDAAGANPSQKHALITRRCPACGRQMRGNIFFRHIKNCKGKMPQTTSTLRANTLRPAFTAVHGSSRCT
jgi:hypothetical protein